jgi:5-methylcytosine-specific restriction endonuclease McrA
LLSRVANVETWVKRLLKLCSITGISLELVKFDMQLMQNAYIEGVEYQQGTLYGYQLREYLLEKYKRKCAYCGKENVSLQVEHIVPRSRAGSNRVSNLTIACEKCNQKKNNKTASEFGYPEVQAQAKLPLKDATAVNSTRWALYNRLLVIGLPLETGSGGLTKFNRSTQNLPKIHWIDAACVGSSTPQLKVDIDKVNVLEIKATGHGSRQRCRPNKYGFPIGHAPRAKFYLGFQTGDIVKAIVLKGKYKGTYTGRIAIRYRPSFSLNGFDVNPKYLTIIHKADGYSYSFKKGDGDSSLA